MFLQFFAFYKFARNHFREKDFLTNLINPFLNFRRRIWRQVGKIWRRCKRQRRRKGQRRWWHAQRRRKYERTPGCRIWIRFRPSWFRSRAPHHTILSFLTCVLNDSAKRPFRQSIRLTSCGYGRSWVQIPAPYTGWTFFTYICKKIVMLAWKDEKTQWEAGNCQFL